MESVTRAKNCFQSRAVSFFLSLCFLLSLFLFLSSPKVLTSLDLFTEISFVMFRKKMNHHILCKKSFLIVYSLVHLHCMTLVQEKDWFAWMIIERNILFKNWLWLADTTSTLSAQIYSSLSPPFDFWWSGFLSHLLAFFTTTANFLDCGHSYISHCFSLNG